MKAFIQRHRIPLGVALAHVIALLAVYVGYLVKLPSPPKEEILAVNLVSMPTGGSPGAQSPAPAPAPPEPAPPQRQPQPRTPPPEPRPSAPAPTRPAWKPNSAADIRKRLEQSRPQDTSRSEPSPRPVDTTSLEQNLNQQIQTGLTDSGTPGGGRASTYNQALTGHLYGLWQQPSRAEVQDRSLTATIRLTIERDGTVTARDLIAPSGNAAMDGSVRALLAALDRCPPFPPDLRDRAITLNVILKLR